MFDYNELIPLSGRGPLIYKFTEEKDRLINPAIFFSIDILPSVNYQYIWDKDSNSNLAMNIDFATVCEYKPFDTEYTFDSYMRVLTADNDKLNRHKKFSYRGGGLLSFVFNTDRHYISAEYELSYDNQLYIKTDIGFMSTSGYEYYIRQEDWYIYDVNGLLLIQEKVQPW